MTILVTGDGLGLGLNGMIGAVVGAIIVTALWMRLDLDKAGSARSWRQR